MSVTQTVDFESGVAWINAQNSVTSISSTFAHTGTYSLRLASVAAGNMAAKNTSTVAAYTPCTPGEVISVSAWFRTGGGAGSARPCQVGAAFYQSNGTTYISTPLVTAVNDSITTWVQVSGTVTAPALAAWFVTQVEINSTGAANEWHYVDDIVTTCSNGNDADTGTGTDAVASLTATTPSADAGAFTDTSSSITANISASDYAGGTDATSLTAYPVGTDTGTGTEISSFRIASSDSGAGTETATSIAGSISAADSGSGTDSAGQVTANIADTETGIFTDQWGNLTATVPGGDTGTGTDAAFVSGLQKTDGDTGSFSDTAIVASAAITVGDSGAFTDNTTSSQTVTDFDNIAGTDSVAIIQGNISSGDAGVFTDAAAQPAVIINAAESGSFAELGQVSATVTDADTSAFTDAETPPPMSSGVMLAGSIPHVFVPPLPVVTITASSAWNIGAKYLFTTGASSWATIGQIMIDVPSNWNTLARTSTSNAARYRTLERVQPTWQAAWVTIGHITVARRPGWNTLYRLNQMRSLMYAPQVNAALGFISAQMQPLMTVTTPSTITPASVYASSWTGAVFGTFSLAGMTVPPVIQLGPIVVTSPLPVAYNYFGTVTGTATYASGNYIQAYRLVDTLYAMPSQAAVNPDGTFSLDLSTTPSWQTGGVWALALMNVSNVQQGNLWLWPSYSGLSVESWVITDTSYLLSTQPANAGGTFSFGFTNNGRKMFLLVDAAGDILAASVPTTGNVRSYSVQPGDPGYTSLQNFNVQCFANQCYSYDQAVCLRAAVAAGNHATAQQLASGLLLMQTTSGANAGGFIFSGQQLSPSYGDQSYRTGAHAICIRALLEYIQAYPADATAITAVTAVGNAFTWLATMLSATSPTTGLYFGGTGIYTGTPQVFNQNLAITWISSEHQFDVYAAFSLAAIVLATPSYATQAANLAANILGLLWDSTHNRFFQGYDPGTGPDPGDPLDMHSWGASFLIAFGNQSAKVTSVLSATELAPFAVTEGAVTGYAPDYSADPDYAGAVPTIWAEGTFGLALAFAQAGDLAKCTAIITAMLPSQQPDGSFVYTTTYDPVSQMTTSEAVIGGAWLVLADVAGPQNTVAQADDWRVLFRLSEAAVSKWATVGRANSGVQTSRYNFLARVTAPAGTNWNILPVALPRITATRASAWVTVGRVGATGTSAWDIIPLPRVSAVRASGWNVSFRGSAAGGYGTSWNATGRLSVTFGTRWDTCKKVTRTSTTLWETTGRTHALYGSQWHAHGLAAISGRGTWVTASRRSQAVTARWNTTARTHAALASGWEALGHVTKTGPAGWTTRARPATACPAHWNAAARKVTGITQLAWAARKLAQPTRLCRWNTRVSVTKSGASTWNPAAHVTIARTCTWSISQRVQPTGSCTWNEIQRPHTTGAAKWNTFMGPASPVTLAVAWNVKGFSGQTEVQLIGSDQMKSMV